MLQLPPQVFIFYFLFLSTSKGARELLEEIKQSKQDLQVQIACCERELDEAKKYKEEHQRLDGLLLKNTIQISAMKARADRELQAHHDLIREFKAFRVQAKQEKDFLVTQFTHEKDALIAQAQRTIDTLQASLIQVETGPKRPLVTSGDTLLPPS